MIFLGNLSSGTEPDWLRKVFRKTHISVMILGFMIFFNSTNTGWWFGTFFIFHNIWDVILPIDEIIFFRGVGLNHQLEYHTLPPSEWFISWSSVQEGFILLSCHLRVDRAVSEHALRSWVKRELWPVAGVLQGPWEGDGFKTKLLISCTCSMISTRIHEILDWYGLTMFNYV